MISGVQSLLNLSQVFNAIHDYVAIIDKDFNVLNINTAYLKLLGLTEEKVVGNKCYDILRGSLCHSDQCPLKRALRKQKVVEFETQKRLIDGSRVPLILTATPLTADDGSFIGIIESFKDISDFKLSKKKA